MTYHIRLAQPTDAEALARFLLELGWSARLATTPAEQVLARVQHGACIEECQATNWPRCGTLRYVPHYIPGYSA